MMRKNRRIKWSARFLFLVFFAIGVGIILGQSRPQGNPSPQPVACNNNAVCEVEEWVSGKTAAKQPCPDCRPKTYPPLIVEQVLPPFAMTGDVSDWAQKRVFQVKLIGTKSLEGRETVGVYSDAWASGPPVSTQRYPISQTGDADNDGLKEIVALVNFDQKGWKFRLYKTGAGDNPTWESPFFDKGISGGGSYRISDIDGDSKNEIVTTIGNALRVYRITPSGAGYILSTVWTIPGFGDMVWSINIADADNQGDSEIVLGICGKGSPYVFKYVAGDWILQPIDPAPSPLSCVDIAVVADLDVADGNGNEVITGGNDKRLHVWKFENGTYRHKSVSEDLGGYTQGVDVGDIDGLLGNEIVTAASQSGIYILKYVNDTFLPIQYFPLTSGSSFVKIGDYDGDTKKEIAVSASGLNIFDFINGGLVRTFNCRYLYGGIGW